MGALKPTRFSEPLDSLPFLFQEKAKPQWGVLIRVRGKRFAEDLTAYLEHEEGFSTRYLRNDIDLKYRFGIIRDFSVGKTNVIIATREQLVLLKSHHREIFIR